MERPTLVVLRALGLGDLLTAVPALRALAEGFAEHRRVLAAPAGLADLMGLIEGGFELVDTAPLAPLPATLRRPDTAVNLHGRGPQSHRVLATLSPDRLIAFAHEAVPESHGGPQWRAGEHEVARWCRLLAESGVPADPGRLDLPAPPARPPAAAAAATLLHVGAASPARRWPPERFAAVARAERAAGRSVVLTGAAGEADVARSVADAAGLPEDAILAGATSLLELAAAVAAAGRVVCGDTGVAHLATALGTPSVVLFGPSAPGEWGPPPDRPHHRALWKGRRGDPHASRPDPGLLEIQVADVLDALCDLPAGNSPERVLSSAPR